jgi:ankyrin repeat/BTB/POZ domain-containing protein 1
LPRGEDQFSGYLRRVFENLQRWGEESDADICFEIGGSKVYAHRIVLATRCPFFEELLQKRWRFKRRLKFKHPSLSFRAFYSLLKYLYTASLDLSEEDTANFLTLCQYCRLDGLRKAVLRELNIAEAKREPKHRVLAKIAGGGGDSLRILIYGNKHLSSLHEDFARLGMKMLQVSKAFSELDGDMESCLEWFHACPGNLYADVILNVQQRFFFCHRFVLMRSEYFKGLQSFQSVDDIGWNTRFQVWTLDELHPDIFSHLLYYLYCERLCIAQELSTQMLVDILDAGEMLLVPGIKESCASLLIQSLSCENAVSLLQIAETFSLSSLRSACCLIIAADFWDLVRPSKEGDEFTDFLSRLDSCTARSIVEDIRESAVALGGSEDRTLDEREELGERLDAIFELLGFTDLA